MYIGKFRNGSSDYYPQYLAEQAESTRNLGRVAIFLGVPALLYFMFQDIYLVKLPGLFPIRLILAVPLLIYTVLHFLINDKRPGVTELLHSLLMTSIMVMSVSMNYYVQVVEKLSGAHSHQALGALIVNSFIVYLLSGISLRWIHLIIGVPQLLVMVVLAPFMQSTAAEVFVFLSNSTLITIVLIVVAFHKEYHKFDEFTTRMKLGEELAANARMTSELQQMLTVNRQLNQQLEYLALHDALTGTYPRSAGMELLNGELEHCRRRSAQMALVFIDVDGLKSINDTYGHAEGDALLQLVVEKFKKRIRASDFIVRMGGDEFLIVLPECDHGAATGIVTRVNEVLAQNQDKPYRAQFSYGVALFDPQDPKTLEALIRDADAEMYRDKFGKAGRVEARESDAQ